MSEKFLKGIKNAATKKSVTENGNVAYATTNNALVDANFKVSSLRKASSDDLSSLIIDISKFSKHYALIWLFMLRNIRGGMGERDSFIKLIISFIVSNKLNKKQIKDIITQIPEYGRWDDVFKIYNNCVEIIFDTKIDRDYRAVCYEMFKSCLEVLDRQFLADKKAMAEGKEVSLLAKWAPRANSKNNNWRKLCALRYINDSGVFKKSATTYRKEVSALNKYINTTEIKMCDKKWDEIEYSKVPSKANLKYKNAFLKHDEERRNAFLESVEKGESKINAGTLYPYDIVSKYNIHDWRLGSEDKDLELAWKALPNYIDKDTNVLVVRDGSGSMERKISGNITALDVCTALTLYFAERIKGEFNNTFITFSADPKIISLNKDDSLFDKLKFINKYDDCTNTNVESVFDLILRTAKAAKCSQEDLPEAILIMSDMQFDVIDSYGGRYYDGRYYDCYNDNCGDFGNLSKQTIAGFEIIKDKFKRAGYKVPKLIFWNLDGTYRGTIPVIENPLGLTLVSGFSPAIASMVLSGEIDPWKALKAELDSPKYAPIAEIIPQ